MPSIFPCLNGALFFKDTSIFYRNSFHAVQDFMAQTKKSRVLFILTSPYRDLSFTKYVISDAIDRFDDILGKFSGQIYLPVEKCNNSLCLWHHPTDIFSYFRFMLKSLSFAFMKSYDTIITIHSIFFGLPLFAKLLGKKVILIDIGDWPEVVYYKLYYRLGFVIAKIGYSFVFIMRKLLVAAVDEYYTNSFQTYFSTYGKTYLLTSYVKRIINRIASSCKDVSIEKRVFPSILYVGRLDYEKGIIRLLKSYILSKRFDIPLVVVGDGPLKNEIERLSQKIPSIKYMGRVPYHKIFNFYKKYEYLVLPSYTEGIPKVLLEGYICGNKIIIFKELRFFKKFVYKMVKDEYELAEFLKNI
jgi:glycosyltransferase involved in cell wall biosynthesis